MIKINNTKWEDLGKIVFYKNGTKIEMQHDFNNVCHIENGIIKSSYLEKILNIDTGSSFKRAIKENLNRKDNYYLTYFPAYSSYKHTALYIYCDFEVSEAIDHIWERETAYINAVKVDLDFEVDVIEREILPYDPDFRLPEGAKWHKTFNGDTSYDNSYSVVEDGGRFHKDGKYILHFTRKTEKRTSNIFKVGPYTRIEYSEKYKKLRSLSEEIENITGLTNITTTMIEKILSKYDLVKKEGDENA